MKLDINHVSTHIIFLLFDSIEFIVGTEYIWDINMQCCINNFFLQISRKDIIKKIYLYKRSMIKKKKLFRIIYIYIYNIKYKNQVN